jgi:flagellar basal-body rod modification protein FlgD
MTSINPISGANQGVPASSGASSGIGKEFNSFIKLLTAQVKNQDPLSPLDSTQFVEQLATFSALEQQVQTNSTLQGIAAGISQLQGMASALWAPGSNQPSASWLGYEGGDVTFSFDQPQGIDTATLIVRDASGQDISRTTLTPGAEAYAWDGIDLAPGERRMLQFSIELGANGSVAGYVPARFA